MRGVSVQHRVDPMDHPHRTFRLTASPALAVSRASTSPNLHQHLPYCHCDAIAGSRRQHREGGGVECGMVRAFCLLTADQPNRVRPQQLAGNCASRSRRGLLAAARKQSAEPGHGLMSGVLITIIPQSSPCLIALLCYSLRHGHTSPRLSMIRVIGD